MISFIRTVVRGIEKGAAVFAKWILQIVAFLSTHKKMRQILEGVALVGLLLAILYTFVLAPPAQFREGVLLQVKRGSTLEEVASKLKEKDLITSATLFEVVARAYREDGTVVAGEYSFTDRQNIITIAKRLTKGDFELEPVKVRVEEGMSAEQITKLLAQSLPDFEMDAFHTLASKKEGMLYPDTYFFLPGEDPALIVSTMEDNFNEHIHQVPVATAITAFGKTLLEVLTMASLLEKEASEMQDRRIIAGILWRRLENGMKLQVDAVFPYINGKNTFILTKADLAIDSPYNTYVYKGLPPGPIGSPSIDAIMAAVTPVKTSYVYYLSDLKGEMHYSTTYEQHLLKKAKYLDN
ncbi:MAG: endolytic transglycosylase MltG [Patescibacteria group bacterium]